MGPGKNRARGGSSNEVHCAGRSAGLPGGARRGAHPPSLRAKFAGYPAFLAPGSRKKPDPVALKSITVGNRGRSTDPAARRSGPNSKHRHGFQTSPSIPIHPHPPSKPNLGGRFSAIWEPSDFPSKLTLDGLPRPRASHKSRQGCAARPFLSLLSQHRGGCPCCDWASSDHETRVKI